MSLGRPIADRRAGREDPRQRDAGLAAGQLGPDTEVRTVPEADMCRLVGPRDVEDVQRREHRRVVVRRVQDEQHALAGPDRLTVTLVIFGHPAGKHLDWTLATQDLLDGPGWRLVGHRSDEAGATG